MLTFDKSLSEMLDGPPPMLPNSAEDSATAMIINSVLV